MTSLLRPPADPPAEAVRFPEWRNVTPESFSLRSGLSHRLYRLVEVLEARCRTREFCWVGNASLAEDLGLGLRATKYVLHDLEAAGWILRVLPTPGYPGRAGIILFRRANPDLPVASPDRIAETIARMNQAKALTRYVGGRKLPPTGAEICPRFGGKKLPPNKDEVLNKDKSERSIAFACAHEGENPQNTQATQTVGPLQSTDFAAAEDLAVAIQARLYHDLPPGLGAADWNQWSELYESRARDVLAGRLSAERLDEAIALARRLSTNKRGARFFGAVRAFQAGRVPRGLTIRAEAPPAAPVVVAPAAPVAAPPPVSVPPPPPVSVPPPEIQPLATPDQVEEARDVIRQFGPKHPAGRLAAQFLRDHGLDPVEVAAPTAPPSPPAPEPGPASVPVPTLGRVRRGRGGQTADQIRAQDQANRIASRDRLAAQIAADPDHMLAPSWRKALAAILESLNPSPDPDPSA